jgi:predicted outer membrane repeat protein
MLQVSLNYCALTGNIARQGGAAYLSGDSSASFAHCALQSNSAAERGGAVCSVDRAQVSAAGW